MFSNISNYIGLRSIKLETDRGVLFEEIESKHILIVSENKVNYPHYDSESEDHFYEIIIAYDGYIKDKYQRTYKKLQSLFAEIGGIIKILTLLGVIICKPISSLEMRMKMVNHIY